ncbi:TetR/AcrR family transcriptional regulator [Micromonospora endophytica]|uniref:TetR family transcriptional regulator n=1 Tax=Micromonospora endophytica TaxID=515350 RepID=A0A2W2CVL9_9ACTN|nr:TetR family transcriptional regulator [Micromonospora endophytica]PZF95658.1 TetR family transcriptional regulator [Micromonospora endophytica]RIW48213.1 TetR family transcriptional regulator [Micromonospora endophytica]BCJ56750.1 TetR family transcriptional regulator [Micromonospora endophytica]
MDGLTGRTKRVAVLADAAIALLAENGVRGLTHRAVDARAGMPAGTTSAYLRSRQALIEAVVQRLADLDRADLGDHKLPTTAPPPSPGPPLTPGDLDQLAAGIAGILDHWLSAGRDRTLARYACLLEAVHRPQLRTILAHGTVLRAQAEELLARAGAPDPRRQGHHFGAFVDGLLFDRLVGAGALSAPPPGTPASRTDLTAAVRDLLRALTT